MENNKQLEQMLGALNIAAWQYHRRAGSTNDLALAWAQSGAPDGALVLADEQTAGRGRGSRRWVTRPGSALAMSLVLRPKPAEQEVIPRFTALAGLGLIHALAAWGLRAALKWPNDVLLDGKKIAGVLVEADWRGERLDALVVGMGVNVSPGAVPEPDQLRTPATSVADALGKPVDRWELLGEILVEMQVLRRSLPSQDFTAAWNKALAFLEEWIWFREAGDEDQPARRVRLLGVGQGGQLIYENRAGKVVSALAGEILMTYHQNKDPLGTNQGLPS